MSNSERSPLAKKSTIMLSFFTKSSFGSGTEIPMHQTAPCQETRRTKDNTYLLRFHAIESSKGLRKTGIVGLLREETTFRVLIVTSLRHQKIYLAKHRLCAHPLFRPRHWIDFLGSQITLQRTHHRRYTNANRRILKMVNLRECRTHVGAIQLTGRGNAQKVMFSSRRYGLKTAKLMLSMLEVGACFLRPRIT